MAGRKSEPLDGELNLTLKGLKLRLIDIVTERLEDATGYIPYMSVYDKDIEALVALPEAEQSKGLRDIANKVIASYKWSKSGDRKHGYT